MNGIAVLSEDRFLNRIGWSAGKQTQNAQSQASPFGDYSTVDAAAGGPDNALTGVKSRLINLISATRTLLRFPLIAINIIIILYDIILG